jgi:hypothetical protein
MNIGLSHIGRLCLLKKMEEKVLRECGTGWSNLIDPLEARVEKLGGTVQQIKEKFGGLRFYFYQAETDSIESDAAWAALQDDVDQAERDSRKICEMCGNPGVLRTTGSWLKTLCDDDALLLGYRNKVTRS